MEQREEKEARRRKVAKGGRPSERQRVEVQCELRTFMISRNWL